ncbi:MAG: B12-binding domain-containing radical SAM protein [Planctomycetota bacterium]|jgi:radical SAM superfamily enzyme YgiQ (UPF0313 family)
MKVVFIQRDSFAKLGVERLSAVLKHEGHECDIFIESGERRFIKSILESGADLFAFSCTTGEESWVSETASKLRQKSSTPVMVGGPHATFYPQFIEDRSIDYLCRGEGETALPELLEAMAANPERIGQIPNVWSKDPSGKINRTEVRPLIEDLDSLPMPDFDIYGKYKYLIPYHRDMFPVITGRGCPYNCSYCFNKKYREIYANKGKYLRRRSPENVIEQLLQAKEMHDIRKINFVDDSFFCFPGWLQEFAELYQEKIRLPFIINAEATQTKKELVRLVKEMGCICVRMGVESGNERLRRSVLNKKVSDDQIRAAAGHIKHYGMKLVTYNMLGLPDETVDTALETYSLNKEIGTDVAQCTLLQPYPGTAICEYIREKGLLKDDQTLQASCFVSSNLKLQHEKEIINLQKLIQVFLQLRLRLSLVRRIITLPRNPLFHLIFRLSWIFSKMRVQEIRPIAVVIMGLHSLSYMKEEKNRQIGIEGRRCIRSVMRVNQ